MAKDKLTDYDATASNNTDVGGISVAEGMLPSGVNNAIREQMSHLADFASGTSGVDVLKLQDDTDTNSIKLQAPASVTADTTFTLPDGDGSADQVLKTDGAGQLGWVAQTAVASNPSLIINGAFTVAQRGTSATVTTGSAPLTVDRFSTNIANLDQASLTESQSTTVPSGEGFANSFKVVVGGTAETTLDADEQVYIRYQGIEGQDAQHLAFGTSSAKKTTLSFWVRSGVTGNYAVLMYTNNGIGGASPRSQTLTYTVNSADTWEYKTITFDGDGASGNALANDTSAELQLYFSLAAGSNNTATDGTSWGAYAQGKLAYGQTANLIGTASAAFYITGVKLEVGETATPFEHRSYGDELARCQRYYQQYLNPPLRGTMSAGSASSRTGMILPVPMRATPSVTMTQTGASGHAALFNGVSSYTISSILASYLANFCIEFDFNLASAPTAGTPAALYQSSTLQSKFAVSAEI